MVFGFMTAGGRPTSSESPRSATVGPRCSWTGQRGFFYSPTFAGVRLHQTAARPLWVKSRHVQRKTACPLYPESGHLQCNSTCPLCANSGLMHCRQSASVFVSLECIVCICQRPYRRMPIVDIYFFREQVWLGVCDTRDRWPPACNGSGCRYAPISINLGFTGNRSSHMRKVRRANVAHANRAGWTRLGETHV